MACFLADFFQRLEAVAGEAGADHVHALDAGLGQRHQRWLGIGLQPLGLAEAGLEGHGETFLRQPQTLGQQAGGFQAFGLVGVAQVAGAFGHAVKAHHQVAAHAVGLPVLHHPLGQGLDIAWVVVVAVHKAQLGNVALGLGPVVHRVTDAGRRGAGVLRVQRQNQDARGALGLEGIELLGNGRLAIAHGKAHQHVVAGALHPLLQDLGLAARPVQQGRTQLRIPDGGVLGGRLLGALAQDDPVQDQLPDRLGNFHHAVIGQKFSQIALHRRGGRGVGGAEVAQQHGQTFGLSCGQGGFRCKA